MSKLNKITGVLILAGVFGIGASTASAANFIVKVGVNSAGSQANAFTDSNSNTSPAVTNAQVGDTITFNNFGASPGFHNVVSTTGATQFRCANGCGGTNGNPSSTSWTATITLTSVGTVNYFCEVHGAAGNGMFGTINVTVPVGLQSFEID